MLRSAERLDLAAPTASAGPGAVGLRIGMITLLLALAVFAIAAASFSGMISLIQLGVTRQDVPLVLEELSKLTKFLLKFDLGGEQTVAAWLSSMLMLLCGLVLFYIATLKRHGQQPYAWHWLGLSLIFLGLSMDEAVGFHEMTIMPLRELFGARRAFLYAWVIPASAFVGAVALAYLGFLWHLEPWLRLRFLLAGGLFVGGAIGFEMLEGVLADFYLRQRLLHEAAVHLEDLLEFAGVLIFFHSLLRYAQRQGRDVVVRLT